MIESSYTPPPQALCVENLLVAGTIWSESNSLAKGLTPLTA